MTGLLGETSREIGDHASYPAPALPPEKNRKARKAAAQKRWREKQKGKVRFDVATGLKMAPEPVIPAAGNPLGSVEADLAMAAALAKVKDDGIRQYHGIAVSGATEPFIAWEGEKLVHLGKGTGILSAAVTPRNARYIADRLYELARRIEQRQQP